MDEISRTLHTYLVSMAYQGCTHHEEHQMEHLMALLDPADEEAIIGYYGLFSHQRLSLADVARQRDMTEEQALATIQRSLRRLAVTPEWQMMSAHTHSEHHDQGTNP